MSLSPAQLSALLLALCSFLPRVLPVEVSEKTYRQSSSYISNVLYTVGQLRFEFDSDLFTAHDIGCSENTSEYPSLPLQPSCNVPCTYSGSVDAETGLCVGDDLHMWSLPRVQALPEEERVPCECDYTYCQLGGDVVIADGGFRRYNHTNNGAKVLRY